MNSEEGGAREFLTGEGKEKEERMPASFSLATEASPLGGEQLLEDAISTA